MREVKRHSVTGYGRQDINYNDPEGEFVYYEEYAELQQKLDAISAKALELCSEAACVYQKYNITQMPDKDLVDHQTIQELSDLIRSGTHDAAREGE